jgi:cytochrome P450
MHPSFFVTVVGVTLSLAWVVRKRKQKTPSLPTPPGSLGYPLLGEFIEYLRSPVSFDLDRVTKYGKNFTTHLYLSPHIRVGDVRDKLLLSTREYTGAYQTKWPDFILPLLGAESFEVVTGKKHARLRRLLHVCFTPDRVASFETRIHMRMLLWLDSLCDGQVHSSVEFKRLTLDILCDTVLHGLPLTVEERHCLTEEFEAFVGIFEALIPFNLPGTKYRRACMARTRLVQLVTDALTRVRLDKLDTSSLLYPLLTYRDETEEPLPMDVLVDNLILLLFAGYDTTSVSLSSLLTFLLDPNHADVMQRLREEAEQCTWEVWKTNTYVTAVMDETWRLHPPIRAVIRQAHQDIPLQDGTYILKGMAFSLSPTILQMDPEVWGKDVYSFRPERFLEQPSKQSFLTFGAGTRMCLGEGLARIEIREFLYQFVIRWAHRFRLNEVRPHVFPLDYLECTFTVAI